MSYDSIDRIKKVIPIMNEVSESFCLAKWYHASIYLHIGETHSCYHPKPHKIPLKDLETNPSALHNTITKKQERALMLVGEKPSGCQYCWNVESLSTDHISDRMIRNNSIYTPERLSEITDNLWDHNVNPEYIELAFSNECNFKCGYCHPTSSTSFANEIKTYGPYTKVKNHNVDISRLNIIPEDDNKYVEAWWRWWPELSKTLNILRITGGEPLLHKSTWRLFETLKIDPKPNLELNVNSNLGMTNRHVVKLTEVINDLKQNNKIKNFKLYSSMDTWGNRAEYLRTGLQIGLWEKNLETYLVKTKSPISIMCTFNILSVTSFIDFLEKVLEWRFKYQHLITSENGLRTIRFDSAYLKEPLQYDMLILPKDEYVVYFDKILSFIEQNKDEKDLTKFSDLEYEKFRRVKDYFVSKNYDQNKIKEGRIDFYNWFSEYDQRRKTNFLETFPEMSNFWYLYKDLVENV